MTCNALGSLWNQFCQKCAMFCDCSRNNYNVVVGDVSPEAIGRLQAVLQKKNDLREAVREMRAGDQPVEIDVTHASMPTGDDIDENRDRISAGIIAVAARCLGQLSQGSVDLDHNEGWCRFAAASALAGIDLADKIQKNDPLTERERSVLQADVRLVCRVGSPAAFLWNLLKGRNIQTDADLANLLKLGVITAKQRVILSEGLNRFGAALLGPDSFAEALPEVQAIFVRAAKGLSRKEDLGRILWSEAPGKKEELSQGILIRASSKSEPGIPEMDEKFPSVSVHLSQLIDDLSIQDADLPAPRIQASGMLRAQLLAYSLGISPRKIEENTLTREEAEKIRDAIPRLNKLQGAVTHLYLSLKRTIVWEELRDHYGYTPAVLQALKLELGTHMQFLADLGNSADVSGLKVYALAVLFRLAAKFPDGHLLRYNDQYKASEWLSASKVASPGHKSSSPVEAGLD